MEPLVLLSEDSLRAAVGDEIHPSSSSSVINNDRPGVAISDPWRLGSTARSSPDFIYEVLRKDSTNSVPASHADLQEQNVSEGYTDLLIASSRIAEESKAKMQELVLENSKLQELLEENLAQQETLGKSSATTAEQKRKDLAVWREKMKELYECQKQRFEETKELMKRFEKENSELETEASEVMEETSNNDQSMAQESEIWKKKCNQQGKEIKHLREITASLEQQLNVMCEKSFPLTVIRPDENRGPALPSDDRLHFILSVNKYNSILKKFSKCYAKQGSRYVNVQEWLTEAIDVIQDLENVKGTKDAGLIQKGKQEKLASCRTKLRDELQKITNEIPELINAQSQFQGILYEYDCILDQLEMLRKVNDKLKFLMHQRQQQIQPDPTRMSPYSQPMSQYPRFPNQQQPQQLLNSQPKFGQQKSMGWLDVDQCHKVQPSLNPSQRALYSEHLQRYLQ